MKNPKVIIFGLGSLAELSFYYLRKNTSCQILGFTADSKYIKNSTLLDQPIYTFEDIIAQQGSRDYSIPVTIGYSRMNRNREEKFNLVKSLGIQTLTYIDPNLRQRTDIEVGENSWIFENTTIQPFTKIGNNTIIGSNCHIGHHSMIGDHCYITLGAALCGNVTIGNNCFIGANATIVDGVTLAPFSFIGAGVTISKDTKEGSVYTSYKPKLRTMSSLNLRL